MCSLNRVHLLKQNKLKLIGGISMIPVVFSKHPRCYNNNDYDHDSLSTFLEQTINEQLSSYLPANKVDIFSLIVPWHCYEAGIKNNRLVILLNATNYKASRNRIDVDNAIVFGQYSPVDTFLPTSGEGIVLTSPEGIDVAEWNPETWELNILFDIFSNIDYKHSDCIIFTNIMKLFKEIVLIPMSHENSWKYSTNKDKLTDTFLSMLKDNYQQKLSEDRENIRIMQREITRLQAQIKNLYDTIRIKMNNISGNDQYIDKILSTLSNDLNIIVADEKVTDVIIDNESIIIKTIPLRIYADNGNTYQAGEFNIRINMFSSLVTFTSNKGYRSYWTDNDPHPHISGIGGVACLGNIESTVAELCSQMQLYPLFIMLIDYLESANTEDAAGRYVVNWPLIDSNGNIIHNDCEITDFDNIVECDECGCVFDVDDSTYAFNSAELVDGEWEYYDEACVCPDCLDRYYFYIDNHDVYLRKDVEWEEVG
jgi:hypothetical protein